MSVTDDNQSLIGILSSSLCQIEVCAKLHHQAVTITDLTPVLHPWTKVMDIFRLVIPVPKKFTFRCNHSKSI